jgi:broad specificity phosphatase PhoE
VWQGTSDSPLTGAGRHQVRLLAERFAGDPFDLVVGSHLERALTTADALGGAEPDERWRELHLGAWEGMSQAEIAEREPTLADSFRGGADIAFGGGEKVSEMVTRLLEAFEDLVGRLDDGQRAAVVGHGGALLTLIEVLLGSGARSRLVRLTNTGLTTFRVERDGNQMTVFNDTTHLPGDPVRAEEGSTHVVLARHGQTVANIEGRWQGRTGGELTERGALQARALGSRFPAVDALYSSPLGRALDTARMLNDGRAAAVHEEEGLQELSFGSWEMMTTDEIAGLDSPLFADLVSGVDVRRGGDGETFAELRDRVSATVDRLAQRHSGGTIGVVSHGAATRAYATGVLGLDFSERGRLGLLHNTAMARVVFGERGPAIASWNLTPHLKD